MDRPKFTWYVRDGARVLKFESERAELISATDVRRPAFTTPGGGLSGPILNDTEWVFRTVGSRFFLVRTNDYVPNEPPKVGLVDENTARRILARHVGLGEGCVRVRLPEPRKEVFA